MSVTTGCRVHFREMLRRAREQSVLTLAATNAVIDRRDQRLARAPLSEAGLIEHEIDQFIAEQESATLVAIYDALQVLRETPDLYGVCEECGEPISLARLNIAPWISRCDEHAKEPVQ